MGKHPPTLAFAIEATRFEGDECLLWPFAKVQTGYGLLGICGHVVMASRFVCEARYGPRPSPHHDCAHSCDMPACVNPKHLRWATRRENLKECAARGRHPSTAWKGISRKLRHEILFGRAP